MIKQELMECGHPKACLVPEHFFIAMRPCNKPYDVYVCEICGQNMHKHTDGGGTAWIMKEYCSACAERGKMLGVCIDSIKLESTLDPDANAVYEQGYQAACSNILHAISKLSDTAPSSTFTLANVAGAGKPAPSTDEGGEEEV